MATEEFDNVAELCAAILVKGVSVQLKRGLGREYIEQTEFLSLLRGRMEVSESIKTQSMRRNQLVCSYDVYSVNSYPNRIIKTTMEFLLKSSDISKARKKELRRLRVYFAEVETLDVNTINWEVQYNRSNQTYCMLVSICYLVLKGLLQTNSVGTMRLMDFLDEQRMCRLYEKFILEYFRREFPQVSAKASLIPWALDDGMSVMLPVMQSDVTLAYENKVLIIDAKYYARTTQEQYNVHTLHSNNLYQIFTYVKNMEVQFVGTHHEVSGMLLYARTDEEVQPENTYRMSGNTISVRTLDLNCDFSEVAAQLNRIVAEHFGVRT